MSSPDRQKIVVGIIYNDTRDKVLLSRRLPDVHQGGLLEFPGGKSNPGESPMQTLVRELKEEIDIQVVQAHPLTSYNYDYDDRQINLSAWEIDHWKGIPQANEGQEIKWTEISNLKSLRFPQANVKLIKSMALPQLYFIIPDLDGYGAEFIKKIEELISNGLRFIQFRNPSSPADQHKEVMVKLLPICERYACSLIYNGSIETAVNLGAHGVHLNSSRLFEVDELTTPSEFWTGASCHNVDELMRAQSLGVDYCVISPVHTSPSHPKSGAIGWDNFALLAQKSNIPVYALGGIKPDELEMAVKHGAHGIAMISGLWNAVDPVSEIKLLRGTLE